MANNNQQGTPTRKEELVAGLSETLVPLDANAVIFVDTFSSLANKICDLFQRELKIHECDHVALIPVTNEKTHALDTIGMVVCFDVSHGDDNSNISRIGGRNKGRNDRELTLVELTGGARSTSGSFKLSDKFKSTFMTYAAPNSIDDGRLIVRADESDSRIATIECDFFKVLELVLCIGSDDQYSFGVDYEPIYAGSSNKVSEYRIFISKNIDKRSTRRRGRGGINYDSLDSKYSRMYNNRNRR